MQLLLLLFGETIAIYVVAVVGGVRIVVRRSLAGRSVRMLASRVPLCALLVSFFIFYYWIPRRC